MVPPVTFWPFHLFQCPGCNSLVMRKDLNNLNVECSECTERKGRIYRFCWQCMREWKGPAPRSDGCDNNGCQSPLDVLRNCAVLVFKDVKGVHGCPSIRACPTCGMLLEHNKRQCKSIVCKRCNIKFCFVCLSTTLRCLNAPYENCPGGVAPRQTTLPVWKLKKWSLLKSNKQNLFGASHNSDTKKIIT